jgi:bifunctional UDP-N-acetylglucosamine pyrophosphorylase/glucosamine-1-phosphate N-acetyltransferase
VERVILVTGHEEGRIRAHVDGRAEFVTQAEQLGTGHAVMQAREALKDFRGRALICCGDAPLWRPETLAGAVEALADERQAGVVVTMTLDDPTGYGRIVRDAEGRVARIVEHRDADEETRRIREVNSGTYCFRAPDLFEALDRVGNANVQGQYYLTDAIEVFGWAGRPVTALQVEDADEAMGINSRAELARAEEALRRRTLEAIMRAGVTVVDPAATWIEADVAIGRDTTIEPGTIVRGRTTIGEGCRIGPFAEIVDSTVGDGARVSHSVVEGRKIEAGGIVGPFKHLRRGAK